MNTLQLPHRVFDMLIGSREIAETMADAGVLLGMLSQRLTLDDTARIIGVSPDDVPRYFTEVIAYMEQFNSICERATDETSIEAIVREISMLPRPSVKSPRFCKCPPRLIDVAAQSAASSGTARS